MEFTIYLLNKKNPYYNLFLDKTLENKQWKHLFFLENIELWLNAFSKHALPYLVVFTEDNKIKGFLPILEKKGSYFYALSDFLLSDGLCIVDQSYDSKNFDLNRLFDENKYCFCLTEDTITPKDYTKIKYTEYFLEKNKSFEDYISNLGQGWKKEIRRRRNIWEKNNLQIKQIDDFNNHIANFFVMHKKKFGNSFSNSKEIITFVHWISKKKIDEIYAYALSNEKIIGYIVWVKMGLRLNLFSMVYDETKKDLNIGKALIYYSLEKLFQLKGDYEINFDESKKEYKLHWTNKTRDYFAYLPMDA